MVKALFDTCILIDFLNGIDAARTELALYDDKAISAVTWMEVMVGTTPDTESSTRQWLDQSFDVLVLDRSVMSDAVALRKARRIKLPDAVIQATARTHERLFVTRNTKDFDASEPGIRMPYQV